MDTRQRTMRIVVASALAVKSDKCTSPADRLVDVHIRVHKVPKVSDDDAIRIYSRVFENVELFERRLAGNPGVRKDRKVRRHMRLADGAKHFAFVRSDLVP